MRVSKLKVHQRSCGRGRGCPGLLSFIPNCLRILTCCNVQTAKLLPHGGMPDWGQMLREVLVPRQLVLRLQRISMLAIEMLNA